MAVSHPVKRPFSLVTALSIASLTFLVPGSRVAPRRLGLASVPRMAPLPEPGSRFPEGRAQAWQRDVDWKWLVFCFPTCKQLAGSEPCCTQPFLVRGSGLGSRLPPPILRAVVCIRCPICSSFPARCNLQEESEMQRASGAQMSLVPPKHKALVSVEHTAGDSTHCAAGS